MRDDEKKTWMSQWRSAAIELEKIRAQELRGLSEQNSADLFNRCAIPECAYWISPERLQSSGLVEQQKFFMRSAEYASGH
ncbi:MAG: hypothetical protein ACOYM3_20940 [Terrimicrobiaceae bacterium]